MEINVRLHEREFFLKECVGRRPSRESGLRLTLYPLVIVNMKDLGPI
jgi:hypothetical protein